DRGRPHRLVGPRVAALVDGGLERQRAGRAGVGALAATHTARIDHRQAQVEADPRLVAEASVADHLERLDLAAAAHAPVAQDAVVVIDVDDRRTVVEVVAVGFVGPAAEGSLNVDLAAHAA